MKNFLLGCLGLAIFVALCWFAFRPTPVDTISQLEREAKALQRDQKNPAQDDPTTTNDERNDQPLGHFGNTAVEACTVHNDTCYTLDAYVDEYPETLYFPKGGNVDMVTCDNLGEGLFVCTDENDREWTITPEYY